MGREITTTVTVEGQEAQCRVLLECSEIILRGAIKRKFPREGIKNAKIREGWLKFECNNEIIAIQIGNGASAWLDAIKNPRTRIQKLGISSGMKISVLGKADKNAIAEITSEVGKVPSRRIANGADIVLYFTEELTELSRLREIGPKLADRGAVWLLWPKGRKDYRHEDVMTVARSAGLTQTKSMSFSETLTGLRLVRPATNRKS